MSSVGKKKSVCRELIFWTNTKYNLNYVSKEEGKELYLFLIILDKRKEKETISCDPRTYRNALTISTISIWVMRNN